MDEKHAARISLMRSFKGMLSINFLLMIFILRAGSYGDCSKFINPGITIGYEFGNQPGLTFGVELSYVMITPNFAFGGPVLGVTMNINKNNFVPYFEMEGGFSGLGATYGIEWDQNFCSRIRVFLGTGLYISYLMVFENFDEMHNSELYGALKYPIMIKNNGFNFLNINFTTM